MNFSRLVLKLLLLLKPVNNLVQEAVRKKSPIKKLSRSFNRRVCDYQAFIKPIPVGTVIEGGLSDGDGLFSDRGELLESMGSFARSRA
jgi:hypothetical protein